MRTGGAGSLVMPRGRYTLAEALGDVGGVNPLTANAGQIYVIRDNGPKMQIFHLNASTPDAMVMADQFNLRRRDVIFVDAVPVVKRAALLRTARKLMSGEVFVPAAVWDGK